MNRYIKLIIVVIIAPLLIVSEISFAQDNSDITFDQKAVAMKRAAPQMPSKAKTSGYCCVSYDVNEKGKVKNIETPYCTDSVFSRSAKKTLSKWKFKPATRDGASVTQKGLVSMITYRKVNSKGIPIPSQSGYMKRINPQEELPPRPRDFQKAFRWTDKHFDASNICELTP